MDNDYLDSLFQTDPVPPQQQDIQSLLPQPLLPPQQQSQIPQMSPLQMQQMSPLLQQQQLQQMSPIQQLQQMSPLNQMNKSIPNLGYMNYQQQLLQQQLIQQQRNPVNNLQQQQKQVVQNQQLQNYIQSLQQRGLNQNQIQLHLMHLNQNNNNRQARSQTLQRQRPVMRGSPMPGITNNNNMAQSKLMMQSPILPPQMQSLQSPILPQQMQIPQPISILQQQTQRPILKRPEGTPIFASSPYSTQIFSAQQLHGIYDPYQQNVQVYQIINNNSTPYNTLDTIKQPQLTSSKKRLEMLADEMNLKLDNSSESVILKIADYFLDQALSKAAHLSKLSSQSETHNSLNQSYGSPSEIKVADLQLELELGWNIRVPGYDSTVEPLRVKNTSNNTNYNLQRQLLARIKKDQYNQIMSKRAARQEKLEEFYRQEGAFKDVDEADSEDNGNDGVVNREDDIEMEISV